MCEDNTVYVLKLMDMLLSGELFIKISRNSSEQIPVTSRPAHTKTCALYPAMLTLKVLVTTIDALGHF